MTPISAPTSMNSSLVEREEPAVPEGESAQQVQRDRRHADAPREAAHEAQAEDHGAQFDQQDGGVVHVLGLPLLLVSGPVVRRGGPSGPLRFRR